jgi:branched-chain amino acid transport system permease protein
MSAGRQGALPPAAVSMREVVKDAAIWALVALGLCFPLIAFRTVQDFSNRIVLDARPFLVALFVLLVFGGRLLWRLYAHPQRRRRLLFPPLAIAEHHKAWLPRAGLAALLIFPWAALTLTGPAGAIKWIDNFGVQILIYVMLAWGLNIVVGLAGLLDLGYVAFYAVGAYTYAIIATYVIPATVPVLGPWAFWICLPIAGILAAFWGFLLGFPVLRLRGDYLAIVTLAFGEIIRLVLINWVALTNGNVGIQTPRITFFGLPFTSRTGETTFADVFHLPGAPTVHR